MNKKKILLLAGVLGLLVVFLIVGYMGSLEDQYVAQGERVAVILAREYIPPYTVLTSNNVKVEMIPRPYIQPQVLTSLLQLVDEKGNNVYTTISPIMLDEQIMTTKLAAVGREAGLALSLPPGMRAVTIRVDSEDGVGMLVRPGNNVDVLGTFEYQVQVRDRHESKTHTKVLLQNVLVVGVEQNILGDHPATRRQEQSSSFGGGTRSEPTLTLAVTPEQATYLTFTRQRGRVAFTLRSMGDNEILPDPDVVDYETLFPEEKAPIIMRRSSQAESQTADVAVWRGIQEAIMHSVR
ncbi:MAG: Flp pilus assembly protein CpaB [Elusimicrobia bacterium]|nr:Flp pilus assembly protein CpaB [Elusimicrobiota bacterium]